MKTEETQILPDKTPEKNKRKSKLIWAFILVAVYSLGFLSFGTFLSPTEGQATQQLFVTALGKSAKDIINPSGRIVAFKNSWGVPTARIILVNDYSYAKTEGRCVFYHYPFAKAQHKECFPPIPRNEISESLEAIRD
ncbi:MAG: hypothetical protein WC878_08035 [Candidatus Paceibacterota bacterium]|jgi:hypothetical protein